MQTPYHVRRRNLPHWTLDNATYFVTWRLHKTQVDLHGSERTIVASAIRYFNNDRYTIDAYVVMNDHVHVLVCPRPGRTLSSVLHTWKSFTAHEMTRTGPRTAPVWMAESFDHIVRNSTEHSRFVEYIKHNPGKRWPNVENYEWVWVNEFIPRLGKEDRSDSINPGRS